MDFELQARGEARFEAQRSCHQEVHQGDNAEKLLLKSLKDEARARKLDSRPWTLRGGSGVPTVPQPSLALHLFPGPLGHKSCLFHLHPLIPRTRSEGFTFLSGALGVGPCSQRAAASDRACACLRCAIAVVSRGRRGAPDACWLPGSWPCATNSLCGCEQTCSVLRKRGRRRDSADLWMCARGGHFAERRGRLTVRVVERSLRTIASLVSSTGS